jgi:uncharacterized protein
MDLVPDLTGALYMPDDRTLIAADLHFEKGSSRRANGVHLPPYDTRSTLTLLADAVARWRPQRLVLLGDSFHDERGPQRLDAADAAGIDALGQTTEIIWIAGNHDPVLDADLPGTVAHEMWLGPLVLRHEPCPGAVNEIAGHLHPVAAVQRRGRKLRRRCFAGNDERLILPAFGAYAGRPERASPAVCAAVLRAQLYCLAHRSQCYPSRPGNRPAGVIVRRSTGRSAPGRQAAAPPQGLSGSCEAGRTRPAAGLNRRRPDPTRPG